MERLSKIHDKITSQIYATLSNMKLKLNNLLQHIKRFIIIEYFLLLIFIVGSLTIHKYI